MTLEPREIAGKAERLKVSPDGKTIIVFDNAGIARNASTGAELSKKRALPQLCSFSPDGKALLLRWYESSDAVDPFGGILVLDVPAFTVVLDEPGAGDAHFVDARTLAYRRGAQPVRFDLATRKVEPLGGSFANFGCTNVEAFWIDGIVTYRSCRKHVWSRVAGVAPKTGEWILERVLATDGGSNDAVLLEAVSPSSGARRKLLDIGNDIRHASFMRTKLSPDGSRVCLTAVRRTTPSEPWVGEPMCGPIAGPLRSFGAGRANDSSFPDTTFLTSSRVLVSAARSRPARIVDLDTGREQDVRFPGSDFVDVFALPGGRFAIANGREPLFLDLDARLYVTLPHMGSAASADTIAADPTNPRRLLMQQSKSLTDQFIAEIVIPIP